MRFLGVVLRDRGSCMLRGSYAVGIHRRRQATMYVVLG